MYLLIAKVLAFMAVIAGIYLGKKFWDGNQIITLIVYCIFFALLCMVPVAIILLLIRGLFSLLGFLAVVCAIGAVIYLVYSKFKKE